MRSFQADVPFSVRVLTILTGSICLWVNIPGRSLENPDIGINKRDMGTAAIINPIHQFPTHLGSELVIPNLKYQVIDYIQTPSLVTLPE